MTVVLPGATLGVMGGGQLARMFVHAAQRMGYFTAVLDPDPASPAGMVSHYHIQADYLDEQGLAQLMQRSAAITTDFANVPAPALVTLGAHRPVAPAAEAIAVAQDRGQQQTHFVRCGVPCTPFTMIETAEQVALVKAELLPGILKTSRRVHDGKGQVPVKNGQELQAAWEELERVPCVLEKLLSVADECSVILARGHDGQMVNLPPQLNRHRGGGLAVTEVWPDSVPPTQARQAVIAAKAIAEGLGYVGVLCVEFFLLADGSLAVNEMAPQPHDSGHYSIDACDVSQFELQVRALAGLPLIAPRQHSPAIMLNLLGEMWFMRGEREAAPSWDAIVALPGAHLHLYGRLSASRGRKMGHLTITAPSVDAVRATAMKAAHLLGIEPF
jgi:5-(carboxyamino)imidazole ribonucleotide synthase